jgi:plastocyanin
MAFFILKDRKTLSLVKKTMKTIPQLFRVFFILLLFAVPLFHVHAKKWVVTVKNYTFVPYNLTHVKAGDTILFQWVEGIHTTTSTSIPQDALEWDYPITQQEPTAMVIPMVNGTYQYVCTPHSPEMNGTFTVSGALGISPQDDVPDIRLFPNPATDKITVVTSVNAIESFRIFDTKGKKAGELSLGKQPGISTHTIDLSNFPPGVLFFEFIMESNRKKVVKVLHTGN